MLLTMLPAAAFAAETEAESGTEQTAPVPEDAVTQPDGGGDDAGGPANNRSSETADISSREELEAALKDSSVSTINIDRNIDMGDTDWNGVQIEKGRTLVINGNDNTISGLKVHKAYMGPNGSGIPGDGGSADYYTAWIANNNGTLTINDLTFSDAEIDANPLTTEKQSTGSSILAVVVANNSGKLVYNNVNVVDSTVKGYSKVGLLHGFTQNKGSFVANKCSVENSQVILEADGTDPEACFSGILIGYDGNSAAKTNGIKMADCHITVDDSVIWKTEVKTKADGTTYVTAYGADYGLTSPTYTHGSNGTDSVAFVAEVGGYQYETLADAIAAAQDGETVKLLKNTELTSDLSFSYSGNFDVASCILETNGHKLSVPSGKRIVFQSSSGKIQNSTPATSKADLKSMMVVEEGGALTIENGTYSTKAAQLILSNGEVVINNGTFICDAEDTEANKVLDGKTAFNISGAEAALTFKNGTLTADVGTETHYMLYGIFAQGGANVTLGDQSGTGPVIRSIYAPVGLNNTTSAPTVNVEIFGGEYHSRINAPENYQKFNGVLYLSGDSNVTIHNGIFTADTKTDYNHVISLPYSNTRVNLTIKNGTFTAQGDVFYSGTETGSHGSGAPVFSVTGGTYSSDPTAYCATGYAATQNENGQWVVSPKEGMEADTSVSGNTASAEVGGTFSGNEDLGQDNVGASNGTLSIDATVTEGDTAAITKTEVSIGNEALTSVSGANSVNSVVLKTNVADLTVDKAAWNAITKNADGAKVALTIEEKAGTGGAPLTYTVTATANGKDVYSADNAAGSIKISVKYEGTDLPKVYYVGPDGLEDMKAELKDGILSWTAKHFSDYVVVSGEQKILVKETNGSLKYYGTLTDAITNAGENAVITLLDNLFEKGIFLGAGTKQFTVDFAGHTFTATSLVGSTGTESQAFHLEKGNTVVLKNGAITVAEDQRANAAMLIQNYCNLTLDNMTLDGRGVLQNPNKPLYALSNNCGEIILKSGTTISADEGDFAFDVCWAKSYETGARVTMEDGVTINGDVQLGLWGNAAYEGSESVLTVNGGTITGALKLDPNTNEAEAIEALKPNVTINGGSFGSSVDAYLDESDGAKAKVEQKDGMQTYYPSVTEAQKHASSGDTVTDLTVSKDPDKTYYDVTLDYADGVSANLKTPVESGKSYTVPADPSRSGYDFLYWTSGGNRYYAGNTIQVNENITLTANWKEQKDDSSSGSSDNERTYAIITEDDGHGSVTVSADEASAGTRITVTVKPDAGYELDELTVTDAKNKDLKVTKRSETTYTFHMADSKVTVEASFTKDGTVQKPDTRFDDVATSAWYYKAVEYVAENGIMSGVSAREFAPNAGFSRAMLAQTLYAMSGKPTVKAEGTFADVAANAWYADAVNWAAEKGYVSGVGDGKFAPDASVTREQMALILYRYAGSPDASGMVLREFADGDSVSAYAVDAIRWAVHEGLISGMENNTLAPQGTATRAQVAQILMNFHQKLDK
jgi:hypothetical protein